MYEITSRILDILSREIENSLSISEITRRIEKIYGSAYYVNIYDKIKILAKEKFVTLSSQGNSSLVGLNFENYLLIDLLANMEIGKKLDLLEKQKKLYNVFHDLAVYINDQVVKEILIIKPNMKSKSDSMELLILLQNSKKKDHVKEKHAISTTINFLQEIHKIQINCFFLEEERFLELLNSKQSDITKDIFSDKIVLFHPTKFWMDVKNAMQGKLVQRWDKTDSTTTILTDDQQLKSMISHIIEKSLTKIGKPVLEEISMMLYTKYKCNISDCYEHPQYLQNILEDLYGSASRVIIQSIEKDMEKFTHNKDVKEFLKVMRK